MPVQIFPAEIFDLFVDQLGWAIEVPESRTALLACTLVNKQFYRRATPYIFSSLSISIIHSESQKNLDDLHDFLNANPDIAQCIRSFTVEAPSRFEIHWESLHVVLKQLSLLQKFEWISQLQFYGRFHSDTHFSMMENLFVDLPSLTAFHLENVLHLPLSFFSGIWNLNLKSLSLVNVRFAEIRADALLGSLFSSLEKLEVTSELLSWSDEDVEAVQKIMVCAAPTLTMLRLILFKTMFMSCEFFCNFLTLLALIDLFIKLLVDSF